MVWVVSAMMFCDIGNNHYTTGKMTVNTYYCMSNGTTPFSIGDILESMRRGIEFVLSLNKRRVVIDPLPMVRIDCLLCVICYSSVPYVKYRQERKWSCKETPVVYSPYHLMYTW